MKSVQKNLLFILPSLNWIAGSEKSLIKMCNILANNDSSKVYIATFTALPSDFSIQINHKINIFSLGNYRSRDPRLWYALILHVNKIKPDILCGWSSLVSNLICMLSPFLRYGKLVLSFRNILNYNIGAEIDSPKLHRFFDRIGPQYFYKKADLITANSKQNLDSIGRLVGNNVALQWLPNVIDVQQATVFSEEKPHHQYTQDKVFKLLFLGRFHHAKGVDFLLKALAIVDNKIPYQLMIVGKGPLKQEYTDLAAQLNIADKIQWVDIQTNPFPYYKMCDVLVFPSRHEGFPNVLLEAMALGKPVIASNCPTGPFEITEGGELGHLFPVGDVENLAERIIWAYHNQDKMQEMGQKAKEYIKSHYDTEIVRQRYLEIFN